ncbi:pilus assembly protein [Cupriavidus sp. AU9028]|uniref:pilus assembly PilX family protein n=1 Tax=Cupriavidus sp. AU9028 TaxID=2871157 RepID=UPI001C972C81|nr:pilus assembly protein [Cupriavidus sp. AU9028]MBY4898164.1 pilus assembly protein [Cupriavidus sp. AU9028]
MSVVGLLAIAAGAAASALSLLQQGYRSVGLQLDREVAFRAAEAALLDGQAELLALASGKNHEAGRQWPAPGACGAGARRHHCTPAPGRPAAWAPWMTPTGGTVALAAGIGTAFGAVTGAVVPTIAPDMGGPLVPPRYLIEHLGDAPAPYPAGAQRYRITALGFGRSPGRTVAPVARVVLQSEWIGSIPQAPGATLDRTSRRIAWRELIPEPAP